MNLLLALGAVLLLTILWIWRVMSRTYPLTTDCKHSPEQIVSQMTLNEKLQQLSGESILVGVVKILLTEFVLKRMVRFYSGYN